MKFYYLSTQVNSDGKRVIHERDCKMIPSRYERDYLGPFNSSLEALRTESQKNPNVTNCCYCGKKKEIYSLNKELNKTLF